MGIITNIRNFFYAATHFNQLVAENSKLTLENQTLSGKLWKAQDTQRETAKALEAVRQQRDQLSKAVKFLRPKDLSRDSLRDLYCSVTNYNFALYNQAGQSLIGNSWGAHAYIQDTDIGKSVECAAYRAALSRLGVLPEEKPDITAINDLKDKVIEAIGKCFEAEQLPEGMPVGRINYLFSGERIEYRNAGEFVSDVIHSNFQGEPMSIEIFSDPKTGSHINTMWALDLDPDTQGFQITPYQEMAQPELTQSQPAPFPVPEPEFQI